MNCPIKNSWNKSQLKMAMARRLRRSALSSFISFTLVYFTFTLPLFRYDWVDQSASSTIFHHQKPMFNVFESKAAIRKTAKFTFKRVSSKLSALLLNSSGSFAMTCILLSGDVELNPGMIVTTNSNELRNTKASKRCEQNITIVHLNVRSIKNRNHFILLKNV